MLLEEIKKAVDSIPDGRWVLITDENEETLCVAKSEIGYNDATGQVTANFSVYNPDEIESIDGVTRTHSPWPVLGSDPEFFFKRDGKVVPAMKFLRGGGRVVADGFQGELNPSSNACRQSSGNLIHYALEVADNAATRVGAEVSLNVLEEIDHETFYSVPAHERRFGCSPTKNPHEKTKRPIGTRTRWRAAGGHIHLGGQDVKDMCEKDITKLVSLFDIFCGTATVLLDRDEGNKVRRKYYGRAGEYRLKQYGIEYRVPSNFWLKSYTLWSTVTVLLRNAMGVFSNDKVTDDLFNRIDMNDVRRAINECDVELAEKIWRELSVLMKENKLYADSGVDYRNVDSFLDWVTTDDPIDDLDVPTFRDSYVSWEEHYHYGSVPGLEQFLKDNY